MFKNNAQTSASLPCEILVTKTIVSYYGFKFFKIVKIVVVDYSFKLEVKIMVGDYDFNYLKNSTMRTLSGSSVSLRLWPLPNGHHFKLSQTIKVLLNC